MKHRVMKNIAVISICVFSILSCFIIYFVLDHYLYSPPTVYSISHPDAEMVKLLQDEFKMDIPDRATIEKVTLNNSKDSIASLLMTGSFDVEYWLQKQVKFGYSLNEEKEVEGNIIKNYSLSGLSYGGDLYSKLELTISGEDKRVLITKRGITNEQIYKELIANSKKKSKQR